LQICSKKSIFSYLASKINKLKMALTEFWKGSEKYICDASLAQAFHMARVLGMPLLIEGEP
jgi:hypothetical protein